jgi:hypothetical protein
MNDIIEKLLHPEKLISRNNLIGRSSIVPALPGIYAWYFSKSPSPEIDLCSCWKQGDKYLLYIGISPVEPRKNGAPPSKNNLRKRIRTHMSGNASSSTLRLSIGCLLMDDLGLELRRVGNTERLLFSNQESALSSWLDHHAFATWVEHSQPWTVEQEAIGHLYLPLNLDMNEHHPFYPTLSGARRSAKEKARRLPVL